MRRLLISLLLLAGLALAGGLWSPGLMGSYCMERADSCRDASGNGNNGVVVNAVGGVGQFGQCLYFDGNNDYVVIADTDAFSFTGGSGQDSAFTITIWLNPDTLRAGGLNRIISKHESNIEWAVDVNLDTLRVRLFSGGGASVYIGKKIANPLVKASWSFLAVTYDGSETSDGIVVYLAAVPLTTATLSAGAYAGMSNTTAKVYLAVAGNDPANTSYSYKGREDELQVVKGRALAQSEIQRVMMGLTP